jgi:hypothetical protein
MRRVLKKLSISDKENDFRWSVKRKKTQNNAIVLIHVIKKVYAVHVSDHIGIMEKFQLVFSHQILKKLMIGVLKILLKHIKKEEDGGKKILSI